MVQSVELRWGRLLALFAAMIFLLLVAALIVNGFDRSGERNPVQSGYRGTGMAQIYSDATLREQIALQTPPPIATPARPRPNGPIAGKVYKNVQVLGDLPLGEFGRTMNEITNWIAPNESCAYCHVEGNFADDGKYTKVVARRMFQMVQQINANWKTHVADTGVTCYTCHRGNAVPTQRWFRQPSGPLGADVLGGSQVPHQVQVRGGALPQDVLSTFLLSDTDSASIRVSSPRVMAQYIGAPVQQAEKTHGLMLHLSQSLGVNCSFCHNTRAFANWSESSPQRQTAWYGIRMVRDINTQFLEPLSQTFPPAAPGRLGPGGDAAKVNCATCHLGAYKPLHGAKMAQHYPALLLAPRAASAPEAAASAAESVPPAEGAAAVDAAASAAAVTMAAAPASAPPPAPKATAPAAAALAAAALATAPATAPTQAAKAPPAPPPVVPSPAQAAAPPVAKAASVMPVPAPGPGPGSARTATGAVVEQAPVVATLSASAASNCAALDALAGKASTTVAATQAQRRVGGSGRLQFHSAPASTCVMPGIFILPKEAVNALASYAGYTRVKYVNPRTGTEVSGWVQADRLAAP